MKIIGIASLLLTKKFEELGRKIAKHNSWFLITPIFITAFLTTGLQRIKLGVSEDYYVPIGGETDTHKSRLKSLFPLDISYEFDPVRLLDLSFYGTVTIQAIDDGSVLRQSVFSDLVNLDQEIRNFTINDENALSYEDICAKNDGKCFENKILLLKNHIEKIENRTLLIKYPVEENNEDHGILSLGGVIVDQNQYIISAQAITLFYFLDNTNMWKEDIVRKWEGLFIEKINELRFKNIKIDKDISISRERAMLDLVLTSLTYMLPSAIIIILFTIFSCLSPDFLRSKPWSGVISAIASGMSLASGFGLLTYIGVVVNAAAAMVPFLVLGIGMDDTFVMLSAWMKTDPKKSIEDRISETYKKSGISITIISLTNIGCFSAGYIFSTLPIFKSFCIFMACSLIFDYIYQITFIGAFLVIFGRAEERCLHSIAFVPLMNISSYGKKQLFRKIFCYVQPDSSEKNHKKSSLSVMRFWIKFSQCMTKNNTKILIIFLYLIYLSITVWGLNKYFVDATLNIALLEGTSRYSYNMIQEKYYHNYQYRLQLFIDENLDYANPQVQAKIEKMIQHLESDPLIAHSDLTGWWLRSYLNFLSDEKSSLFLSSFNLTESFDFLYILRRYFLKIPLAKQFRHDIAFDKNYTSIICSRFFLQTNITRDGNNFYRQLTQFKKKLDTAPYSVSLYHPLFYYFDVIDLIPEMCRQTFSIVIVTVFIISTILLPSGLAICCVLINIFSVIAGIMSFTFLWNVGLSLFTVNTFIVVIGMCIDFAAHISCAYDSTKETDPNQRLVNAVSLTAMPILQGSSTTALAFAVCALVPCKDMIDSVKVITLACIIAAVHSILFLPVIMSLLDSFFQVIFSYSKCSQEKKFALSIEEDNPIGKGIDNIQMKQNLKVILFDIDEEENNKYVVYIKLRNLLTDQTVCNTNQT